MTKISQDTVCGANFELAKAFLFVLFLKITILLPSESMVALQGHDNELTFYQRKSLTFEK